MDDADRTSIVPPSKLIRRYRTLEEKIQIVEEALIPGASVAAVARAHGVNANLVFHWRKLYRAGLFAQAEAPRVRLLPVKVKDERQKKKRGIPEPRAAQVTTVEVSLTKAQVRIAGDANVEVVRTVLECLLR
jgi:transposase